MTHPIPDAALEADIATLAQKGAGKTYLNKGLVERLLSWKRRVIIMDPLNVWWGLQAMADGSPGFPVVVIGGPNADVPLDPAKGRELGEYCARADIRAVIDVSDLKSGQLVSFSTAFLGELYRLNRDPLWLVLEEADVFAPQNPQGNESFMLHEVDQIARRGRQRGFRLWTICQRPQELNKKTLTQASTLVLMRLRAPQDRKAAEAWIVGHGSKEQAAEISGKLASLQVGEGYVWAPDHDILTLAQFPAIATLDNSATPKAGDKRPSRIRLAKPDLKALEALLRPAPVADAGSPAVTKPGHRAANPAELEAAEARGFERGLIEGERRGNVAGQALALARVRNALDRVGVDQNPGEARPAAAMAKAPICQPDGDLSADAGKVSSPAPAPAPVRSSAPSELGAKAKVLQSLLWWKRAGFPSIDRRRACLMGGWSPKASTFGVYVSQLTAAGLISIPKQGDVALTPAGEAAAPEPDFSGSIVDAARAQLSPAEAKVFDLIVRCHPAEVSRGDLADQLGLSRTASTLGVYVSKISSFGFVTTSPGQVRAADWLFPETK